MSLYFVGMTGVPTFETKRLILREVVEADIPSYQKNFADYEIIRHLNAAVPWPYPPNGVETFLRTLIFPNQGKNHWLWGVFLKEQPEELVGCVDLWRQGKPEHRGFWLARRLWGQGLMTEAVRPVMDYAFGPLGFETLIFANALGNARSRRVKEKTGARLLRVESAKFVDPALTQHEIWELTKEEWEKFARTAV